MASRLIGIAVAGFGMAFDLGFGTQAAKKAFLTSLWNQCWTGYEFWRTTINTLQSKWLALSLEDIVFADLQKERHSFRRELACTIMALLGTSKSTGWMRNRGDLIINWSQERLPGPDSISVKLHELIFDHRRDPLLSAFNAYLVASKCRPTLSNIPYDSLNRHARKVGYTVE